MYNRHEEIIARANGLNPRWNFEQIRKMRNPITGSIVQRVLHRKNVKPEDIDHAQVLDGESNEYITQYDNGLMVRELGEKDENPYIKKQVNNN